MGLAMHSRSVQYVEDIDLEEEYNLICFGNCKKAHPDQGEGLDGCKTECKEGKKVKVDLVTAMERAYDKGANNCFVASLLYLASAPLPFVIFRETLNWSWTTG